MKTLLLCTILVNYAYSYKICDQEFNDCINVDEESNREIINQFREWWRQQSRKKPVKCIGEPQVTQDFNRDQGNCILASRKCTDYEVQDEYSFRGRIENFKFEGPGKYRQGLDQTYTNENQKDACYTRKTLFGLFAANITGNFLDGKPNGIAKVDLNGGFSVIGKFIEGILHGRFRRWSNYSSFSEMDIKEDEQFRQLSSIGYEFGSKSKGYCWLRKGNHFIYQLCQDELSEEFLTQFGKEGETAFFIFNGTIPMVGQVRRFHNVITDLRPIQIEKIVIQDCMLHISKYSVVGSEDLKITYSIPNNDIALQKKNYDTEVICPEKDWAKNDPQSNLKSWLSALGTINVDPFWRNGPSTDPFTENQIEVIRDIREEEDGSLTCLVQDHEQRLTFKFVHNSSFGQNGRFKGPFNIRFTNLTDSNLSLGYRDPLFGARWSGIVGYSINGQVQGPVIVNLEDGRFVLAKAKNNVLHGTVSVIGMRAVFPIDPIIGVLNPYNASFGYNFNNVSALYNYRSGRPVGKVWIKLIGQSYMHGVLNKEGKFTGNNMAFIYPDLSTSFVGQFEDLVMKAGRKANVVGVRCDNMGIKEAMFSEPEGPVQFFSPPTNISFGEGPKVMDPWEEATIKLANSSLPYSGEGVITLKDFKAFEQVCPYSGFNYRNPEELEAYQVMYSHNESLSDDRRRHSRKYAISVRYTGVEIHIPWEQDQPGSWHPTLGPKLNSDFPRRRRNCQYIDFDHPRYGMIQGVLALRDIKAGEELFTDYGYGTGAAFPSDFPWYHAAKKEYEKEMEDLDKEKEKKMNEEKANKKKKKNKKKKNNKSSNQNK